MRNGVVVNPNTGKIYVIEGDVLSTNPHSTVVVLKASDSEKSNN